MTQPWYNAGLRFSCVRCGECCRGEPGYVWVTPEEVSAMAKRLGVSEDIFIRKYLRRVGNRHSLRELANGDCVFYMNGCTVYAVRPVQCRTFPFWPEYLISPEGWAEAAERCPGVNKGTLHTAQMVDELLCQTRLHRSIRVRAS